LQRISPLRKAVCEEFINHRWRRKETAESEIDRIDRMNMMRKAKRQKNGEPHPRPLPVNGEGRIIRR
jgi:hypothetical protein